MELTKVAPGVTAAIRPEGANVGLIETGEGLVVVDTTSWPQEIRALLYAAERAPADAHLVVNTHFHSDHTWGNQVFNCPILAHRLCREQMAANMVEAWSASAIAAYLEELERNDPEQAGEVREKLSQLRITLPTEVFEKRRTLELGGVTLEIVHLDAHTSDSSVVWLPESRVLFTGDLIFEGRYPYLHDADVPALIDVLKKQIPTFGAAAIVPGHGQICGMAELTALIDYLETTWTLTTLHVAQGHTFEETIADPAYPHYSAGAERLHEPNVRLMYERLKLEEEKGIQDED